MTDQEIIQGLVDKDNRITREFFFERCRPLFCNIINTVFGGDAEYDELVDELYLYLTENEAAKLKSFQFRSSVYQWLKVLATRFFIRLRNQDKVIENDSQEPPYQGESDHAMEATVDYDNAKEDLKRLLAAMHNRRYAYVIERLVIDDVEPKQLAEEMQITTANLYNIKNHAIHQLTEVALNDIHHYGNQ